MTSPKIPIPLKNFRAGYVAVVGLPNVGKSTLLNRLLQHKISIVSRKPQTTRRNVLGILNGKDYQIIFLDTPGILNPRYRLQKSMMKNVQSAIGDADVLLYLVDCTKRELQPAAITTHLKGISAPVILVLNKIDLVPKKSLLPLMARLAESYSYRGIMPVSAKSGDGLPELTREIVPCLPASPPYYPTDQISDQQERFFVAEIIREKIFRLYGEEIPYSCHVEVEEFRERESGKDFIRALVVVEKQSQKTILIGRKGEALKRVGQTAREDIETFLGRPVFLELFVKVVSDWRQKEALLKRMGY